MKHLSHGLSLAAATLGRHALALPGCTPQQHLGFDLTYVPNGEIGDLYYFDIFVGTPPQGQRVAFDTSSSDLSLHSSDDKTYLATCAEQTPVSTCFSIYDNATSSTYKEVGPAQYAPVLGGQSTLGSYVEDTVILGSAHITNQVFASTWDSLLPMNLLGIAPPRDEYSASPDPGSESSFGRYTTVLQNLALQGFIDSASAALWLDPSSTELEDFKGRVDFGTIDESLFTGEPVTLPVTKNTTVALDKDPFNWNVALSSVALASHPDDNSIVGRPVSCTIESGTTFFSFNNASFTKMAEKFPQAVPNRSVPGLTYYEVPCEERYNSANALQFTLINPVDPSVHFDFTVPADQVIWPANRILSFLDANTCAINALAWEEAFGGSALEEKYECIIGSAALKSVYSIFDQGRLEMSFAKAVPKTGSPKYRSIPKAGVASIFP